MTGNLKIRIGLTLAVLCALTSNAFAQAPPRASELFTVWSSSDAVLSSRTEFMATPPNETMPARDHVESGPINRFLALDGDILVDEPQGMASGWPCVVASVPRKSPQPVNQC